jgi:toxin YoeB
MVEKYEIIFSPQAQKDAKKLSKSNLKEKTQKLLDLIREKPFGYPPQFEILDGDLKGFISRRINKQHRLVYQLLEKDKIIKVLRMWSHYE